MSHYPLVTIGIPTYNRANGYLRQTLESALAQTYPNLEIIVSNNCSTDNTEAVVKGYADPRIRYIRQQTPLIPNDHFNFCLAQARGTYFLLLHDDDMIDADFVDACMRAVNYNTDVGVIRTGARVIDSRASVISEGENLAGGLSTADFFLAWFDGRIGFYLCSTLFNTKRLREIGGFGSRHNLFQDDIAGVKLGAMFGHADVRDVKAGFRVHVAAMTSAAKVALWCEDSLDLLELMCRLAPERYDKIRAKGMRFFATINYTRASNIRPLGRRIAAFFLVLKYFRYRHLPSAWLAFTSTSLYRALRTTKRWFLGLPKWVD